MVLPWSIKSAKRSGEGDDVVQAESFGYYEGNGACEIPLRPALGHGGECACRGKGLLRPQPPRKGRRLRDRARPQRRRGNRGALHRRAAVARISPRACALTSPKDLRYEPDPVGWSRNRSRAFSQSCLGTFVAFTATSTIALPTFGFAADSTTYPLCLSLRCGSRASNIGLTTEIVQHRCTLRGRGQERRSGRDIPLTARG